MDDDNLPPIAERPCGSFALNKLTTEVNEMKARLHLPVEAHGGDTCGACGWTRGAHKKRESPFASG